MTAVLHQLARVQNTASYKSLDVSWKASFTPDVIALPAKKEVRLVEKSSIIHIKAEGNYSRLFLENGEKLFVSKSLKYFDELLTSDTSFFRIHQSYLLNIHFVRSYSGAQVQLKNQMKLTISRRRKKAFINYLLKHV